MRILRDWLTAAAVFAVLYVFIVVALGLGR
jgi:hypothetical protein